MLEHIDLGLIPYQQALCEQEHFHKKYSVRPGSGIIICCEHPSVITLGKNGLTTNLKINRELLKEKNIDFFHTERGGDITIHTPGQLVVYPIINLKHWSLFPGQYVSILEKSIITTLNEFGINANTDPHYPGVWVGDNKIAAIGIRIKNHTTMHGLALNVTNDLELFNLIVACGIADRGVTSMSKERQIAITPDKVKVVLIKTLTELLDQA